MSHSSTLMSCLEEIGDVVPRSAAAAALAQRIRRERLYRDTRVRDVLREHEDPILRQTANEADFLCSVEQVLLAEIESIHACFDWPGSEFLHTLLALESLQRVRLGLPDCPVLPAMIEGGSLDEEHHQSLFDALAGWGYFLEYFGVALKNLMGRCTETVIAPVVTAKGVVDAVEHFAQARKWRAFYEFRTFWEYGELKIDTEAAVLEAGHSELVSAFRISLSRLRTFRFSRASDRFRPDRVREGTLKLPLDGFRSLHELTSAYLASLQFFSADLQEVVHGASLAEWIRAYQVLKDFASATVRDVAADKPERLLVQQTPAFFRRLLSREGGIDEKRTEAIIKHLTFGPTSNDLLDCPLIPFGGRLLMLPAIAAVLEPAHSLESMLHSVRTGKTHELQFIGPGLESSVRASIRDAGVVAHKIVKDKYDCDVAFVLDDVLFLCECKCKFIAADFATYADYETWLRTKAVEQHRRTCDFFAGNLHLVRKKLKLEPGWQPAAIERIIITSAKLGRVIQTDGYWITDHHTVHAYFTRQPATVMVGSKERFRVSDVRLDGPPTASSFVDYLRDPQVIAIHQSYLSQRTIPLEAGELRLSLNDCETYGEVQFVV
jgi:hypothetical protein